MEGKFIEEQSTLKTEEGDIGRTSEDLKMRQRNVNDENEGKSKSGN